MRVTAFLDPEPVSFVANLPRREVYAEALSRAGFWDAYEANPPFELLTARRP
ncbi:hypothetical protein OG785_40185 [Streptomyces sp. NBC_00006]|uniref:hypothetical protein n=1 Tax=Streptomyces sp. NBC_00006 TaxID=2975619 RepID=UPI00224FF342|nr:hypothetical protein [Streptomyces sp. NBC_00006]MCX5536772.1 hypothetical protein [Streptomyces sp. NBC_00006]